MINNHLKHSYLVFKQHFHIKIIDDKRVALLSEDTQFLHEGYLYVEIAKLISSKKLTEEKIEQEFLIHYAILQ